MQKRGRYSVPVSVLPALTQYLKLILTALSFPELEGILSACEHLSSGKILHLPSVLKSLYLFLDVLNKTCAVHFHEPEMPLHPRLQWLKMCISHFLQQPTNQTDRLFRHAI